MKVAAGRALVLLVDSTLDLLYDIASRLSRTILCLSEVIYGSHNDLTSLQWLSALLITASCFQLSTVLSPVIGVVIGRLSNRQI